ncbi:MAG: hypothetical protein MUD08_06025 [Cytophagales bacterium]|jgi:hypothetical protein|nr:hypothetical protein [Cytophagales bacterium]
MSTIYLKKQFKDGMVYYKIDPIANPEDEYVYDGVEIAVGTTDETSGRDEFELTDEDLKEMYDDGFAEIPAAEFEKVEAEHRSLDI